MAATYSANLFKLLVRYDSTNPFGYDGDSLALIRDFSSKEHLFMQPDDIQALTAIVDGEVSMLGNLIYAVSNELGYLMAREIVRVYLSTSDENIIAAAASALVASDSGSPVNLDTFGTVLLPEALASNASSWGVDQVGDGRQILAGIKNLATNLP